MNIVPVDTADRRQVQAFLALPFQIYCHTPQWVPPLATDARRMLDRRRHPFYQHSDAAFFLAGRDDRWIGRIAVLDNAHYNAFNQSRTAFFYLFECEDDCEAAEGLFNAALKWARARGLDRILGPKGFSALDGMGMLVKGFEHRPAFGIPYNPPYYPTLVESLGWQCAGELVSGYLDADTLFPERIHAIADRVKIRRGLRVLNFRSRRELKAIVPRLKALYNASIEGTTDNVPLTDDEVDALAQQLLWFADPRLIKIVLKDDELVGFLFAYPDISAAVQRTRGQFLPFGWLDMLIELKRTKWVNINGAGIVERYRGLGGTALLFSEMNKSIGAGNFRHADLVQISADNDRMQRELRDLGVTLYKTHRMYCTDLTPTVPLPC